MRRGIDASFNLLNGTLPQGLSQLQHSLRSLNLQANHIGGALPDWLGNFSLLQ
jgi:hypothetical protein